MSRRRRAGVVSAVALVALFSGAGVAQAAIQLPNFAIAEAPHTNEVLLSWEPASDTLTDKVYFGNPEDVTYTVRRGTSATGPWTVLGSVDGLHGTSFVDDGGATPLDYLTRYWYQLHVTDGSTSDGYDYMARASGIRSGHYDQDGNTLTAEVLMSPTTGPPVAVRGLSASCSVSVETLPSDEETDVVDGITLTWDAASGSNVDRYKVYRRHASGEDGVYIGSSSTTSFTDTGTVDGPLEVEHHYWYRVSAVAENGAVEEEGPKSFELHVRPLSVRTSPAPHGEVDPAGDSCGGCHVTHAAPAAHLLLYAPETSGDGSEEIEFCLTCHDGTGSRFDIESDVTDPEAVSSHEMQVSTMPDADLICSDCHTPHADPDQTFKLLRATDANGSYSTGAEYCLACHQPEPTRTDDSEYTTRTTDMTAYLDSAHNASGVADPPSGTGIKCRTCHLPHSSPNEDLLMYVGYRACLNCHSSEGGGSMTSPDIYRRMTASSDLDTHHDVLARDQAESGAGRMACQNCHNSHAATESTPVIDPWDPAPWNPYDYTTVAEKNDFCLSCHGSRGLPGSSDTTPWVPAPDAGAETLDDIEDYWVNYNRHGRIDGQSPQLTIEMGYSPSVELMCTACHEPHGTVNDYNLRSDIPTGGPSGSGDGGAARFGVLAYPVHTDTDGVADGYDLRFLCFNCHDLQGMNSTNEDHYKTGGSSKNVWEFPVNCTDGSCHSHGGPQGQF